MPAKKQVNLLPKDNFENSTMGKFVQWATGIGRWIVVFTDLIVIGSFLSRFYFDTKIADLYDKIKQSQAIIEATSDFEQSFRVLQKRLALIKSLTSIPFEGEPKIAFINEILPGDVILTTLSLAEDKITLSGNSLSTAGIANFLSYLVASPRIKNINISQLGIEEKNQQETIYFSLSATWKNL